ncbi:MAG TPA: C39 family peptidase [Spirochaetota bacterium]|nr:C39 family peptidase [Spirochaetota bacterium]HPI90317.1 C39 family peptidase [Spirochaetota bacterium]HPR49723.1 C39 family peptidase [Spirochaetota bacterium]
MTRGLTGIILPILLTFAVISSCDDITAPPEGAWPVSCESETDSGEDTETDTGAGIDHTEPAAGYIGVTDDDFFVKQDDSLCGPTSFYMIFKYYDDPSSGAVLSTSGECLENMILSGISEIFSIIVSGSWITRWLDSVVDGIDCTNFYKKISALSQCIGDMGFPFYAVVDGSCDVTGEDAEEYDAESNIERRERFNYILKNFLRNGYPVILHLGRMYDGYPLLWYPGHYVVLMGYDTAEKKVHIMDPFQDIETRQVMTIDHDSFIMERWYHTAGLLSYFYPDARWDGTWIGFHH